MESHIDNVVELVSIPRTKTAPFSSTTPSMIKSKNYQSYILNKADSHSSIHPFYIVQNTQFYS